MNLTPLKLSTENKIPKDDKSVDYHQLTIGPEKENENYEPVNGRRIIDFNYVLSQLKEKAHHNDLFGCKLENCILKGEKRAGFLSTFIFECNMCGVVFKIESENSSKTETVDINVAAATGITATGIGFSQFEELMSAMDVPVFTERYFSKIQDYVYEKWEKTAVESMEAAAMREREAAIAEGRLQNGIPIIDVYADGCWSARSYGNNYRALSGAATIIGRRFGEVLFMAVKNKYCLICARAAKKAVVPKDHSCYKNYDGSSTGMEAEIISEGFKTSLDMYNIIYGRLIADGDSATYKKILDSNPYGNYTVEKIECRNHVLRNFCNKMRATAKETKYSLQHRKTLTNERIMAMRKAIINSIKHKKEETDTNSKHEQINILHKDILNSLAHSYGDHRRCSGYMCNKDNVIESSTMAQIENSTFMFRLRAIVANVAAKARSLIEDVDTNSVERFNSVVAKYVGGKRVNFTQRRGYQARCSGAVVAFNEHQPISRLYKSILGRSPRGKIQDMEKKRCLKRKLNQKKSRKKNRMLNKHKKVQHDYGSTCAAPDMTPEEYEKAKAEYMESFKNLTADRDSIERQTILQRESSQWLELRKNLLTASNFGQICKRKVNTSTANLVKNLLYKKNISHITSIAHGVEHEMVALQQLSKQLDVHIEPCGLFIDREHAFIGATPDGLIGDDTIVEVKCPLVAVKTGIDVAVKEKKIQLFRFNKVTGTTEINKTSNWFYQVQGQLHVTGRQQCIFGIWAGENIPLKVEYIKKDDEFWKLKMEPKLILFYEKCLLPELIDPRHMRGMPIRDIQLSAENKENDVPSNNPSTSSGISNNPSASSGISNNPSTSSGISRRLDFTEF
ncbi:unnamed protein product [Plutella xylostella]|uniref:(diamondback moth) hypothetical protein n=1 Tax=Plutella xylostella TaxID=51655 RepID=A0A8S4G6F7_PLUXY|nr:unnamed protein product [Plutella xylostella]